MRSEINASEGAVKVCEIRKIPRHSREDGNPPHPSFPRRRESTPSSVIPAKAGIYNSRACGNSSSRYPNAQEKHCVIPAFAGMTRCYCGGRERQPEYFIRSLIWCRVDDRWASLRGQIQMRGVQKVFSGFQAQFPFVLLFQSPGVTAGHHR